MLIYQICYLIVTDRIDFATSKLNISSLLQHYFNVEYSVTEIDNAITKIKDDIEIKEMNDNVTLIQDDYEMIKQ